MECCQCGEFFYNTDNQHQCAACFQYICDECLDECLRGSHTRVCEECWEDALTAEDMAEIDFDMLKLPGFQCLEDVREELRTRGVLSRPCVYIDEREERVEDLIERIKEQGLEYVK